MRYKHFKLYLFFTVFLYCLIFCNINLAAQSVENSNYANPIIPGYNPDPSICRVGEDYYLVTSTFEYFPGVPIYHSRDLVDWKMIGHVLSRPSQLNLDSLPCSGGIFAPTLRYNKGVFYMITTLVVSQGKKQKSGNFIVTATKPEGPWSEPHWIDEAPGIDPSLFFDDNGKVYFSGKMSDKNPLWGSHRDIWVQEFDINSWKLVGKRVVALNGGDYYKKGTLDGGFECGVNHFEGSHLYKKDGKYYLMIAHGGTAEHHAVSIWKSDNVYGPYEENPANPILTQRNLPFDGPLTSTGHADLIQTQNGDWHVVYLGKRPSPKGIYVLGRETYLSPVDWSGVWPVVNPKGMVGHGELVHVKPSLPEFLQAKEDAKDEFTAQTLAPQWTFLRTPRSEWWSLKEKKGSLRIQLRPELLSDQVNPSFIGMRQQQKVFTATVKMDFVTTLENEEAGLVLIRDKDKFLKFTLGFQNGKNVLLLQSKNVGSATATLMTQDIEKMKGLYLRITANDLLFSFSYSKNGKEWITVKENLDGSVLGNEKVQTYTGTMVGMYGSSNGKSSKNFADFDWFEYVGK